MSKTKQRYGSPGRTAGERITAQTVGALDLGPGVALVSGQDLDALTAPGCWYCSGAAVAQTLNSAPGSFPFKLVVTEVRPGVYTQVALRGSAASTLHFRFYNGSWSAWRTLTPAT